MINVEFLRSGKSYYSQNVINKFKLLEKEIDKKVKINSNKRKISYLKLSNAMKELLN